MLKPRNVLLAITVAALVCFATNSARADHCYPSSGYRTYSSYRVPAYSTYYGSNDRNLPYQSYFSRITTTTTTGTQDMATGMAASYHGGHHHVRRDRNVSPDKV